LRMKFTLIGIVLIAAIATGGFFLWHSHTESHFVQTADGSREYVLTYLPPDAWFETKRWKFTIPVAFKDGVSTANVNGSPRNSTDAEWNYDDFRPQSVNIIIYWPQFEAVDLNNQDRSKMRIAFKMTTFTSQKPDALLFARDCTISSEEEFRCTNCCLGTIHCASGPPIGLSTFAWMSWATRFSSLAARKNGATLRPIMRDGRCPWALRDPYYQFGRM